MTAPAWPARAEKPRGLRVVVTGASGTIGSRVARLLDPAHHVRSLTRDPARAARAGVAGRLVGADLADRHGLEQAMAGADALLLVTFDPVGRTHDTNALAAARAGGVRHIVKLSASAVDDPGSQDLITTWQRQCEQQLEATGLSYTLLRSRAFMSNCLGWAPSIREDGVVRALYGTSRNACVDQRDVARAAARALIHPEHSGRAHTLTGPQALSALDQTRQLAQTLRQPLRYEELTEEQALQRWRKRFPEPVAQAMLIRARRQSDGAKTEVANGVRRTTGREPGTFAAWAARHAADFAPQPAPAPTHGPRPVAV
ncbi:NAD(P)H-binding protein [Streptomyces sp. BA2]|uniref:NAD(P)H-binding protein n=1 Tax=Streptomyces sp. BA2 TaxID=436595 RepID=UPI001326EA7B|nr:NAD(P)H-binding protein [Streptomyces sp. BA2]MWA08067.1 NAD(P)H-binding protein [Streptomyces sp. BA2]